MTPSLEQFLKDAERICEEATEGPWKLRSNGYAPDPNENDLGDYDVEISDTAILPFGPYRCTGTDKNKGNASFIAHARADLPLALKMLRRAVEALDEMNGQFEVEICPCECGREEPSKGCDNHICLQEALSDLEQMANGEKK